MNSATNQDFVNAHLPVINLYRPLVSNVFYFVIFGLYFPDLNPGYKSGVRSCFILSIIQTCLAIYYFHVSFYSKKSKCWDKMGWFVHTGVTFCLHLVIPISVVILTIDLYMSTKNGSMAYN